MLRALPIYEVCSIRAAARERAAPATEAETEGDGDAEHTSRVGDGSAGSEESACVSLDLNWHRLAPAGVPVALLDERFVRCEGAGELGLLVFAGLTQLQQARFFREHVFPQLPSLPAATRDGAMLSVLHGLHALCAEDDGFLETLRTLAFVPVASGVLRQSSELFHPKVVEAAELLDGREVYPCGVFADAEVLGVLERLGMRALVTSDAVLQSARSVEALASTDPECARRRARALLQYVDLHADRLTGVAACAAHPVRGKTPWIKSLFPSQDANRHHRITLFDCQLPAICRLFC